MSTSESWREVGAKLEAIGLKLKLHYQQEHSDEQDESRDALTKLADTVDDTFEALGNAAADDAIKADVRDAGQALSNALAATFAEVGGTLKRKFAKGSVEPEATDTESGDELP